MRKIKYNFTLLEVLCAMLILSVGIALLMSQMVLAVKRQERSREQWENTHNLIQAAEFLLLHGEGVPLDRTLFGEDVEIEYFFTAPDREPETMPLSRRTLRKLVLRICKDGEAVDELVLEVLVEREKQ